MRMFEFAVDTMDEARVVFNRIELIGMKSFEVLDDGGCDPQISLVVRHELLTCEQLKEVILQLPRGIHLASFITEFKSRT